MYLITAKHDNRVLAWGKHLDYMENGYPRLTDEDLAFVPGIANIYENVSVGEDVVADKYCYTPEDGFYKNPDWSDEVPTNSFGLPDDVYQQIKNQAIAEVQEGVVNNGEM